MGNSLQEDLRGKVVFFKQEALSVPATFHPFLVESGFGATAHTRGTALIGTFISDGEETRMDGWSVERVATDDEIATFVRNFPKAKTILEAKGFLVTS